MPQDPADRPVGHQLELPLTIDGYPYYVEAKANARTYMFGPVEDRRAAGRLRDEIARMLIEVADAKIALSDDAWFGTQEAPEAERMWSIFITQRKP
jgi:hypothetical protein